VAMPPKQIKTNGISGQTHKAKRTHDFEDWRAWDEQFVDN
jgi:hypothetical protein